MMDKVSEDRLAGVHPELARRIRRVSDMLIASGIYIRVVQAMRTVEEQNDLYAQGRTAPGKIVTNCRGGYSWHNFGCAVDCVPSERGPDQPFDPDWNESHPQWRKMVDAATSLGLNDGADWRTFKDFPHFQLTGQYPTGAPSDAVRALYASGGLQAVWNSMTIPPEPPEPVASVLGGVD
jgi:peptidoglycan L-alanyl-D-glutamate endopeptidase CwlK